jgi:type IVB pilus formation R64 PilN family outer membrane protein
MKKIILSALVLSQLAACTTTMTNKVEDAYADTDAKIAAASKVIADQPSDGNSATTTVKGIWLGGKSVPFKTDLALPSVFHARKDFLFPKERMTIAQAADRFYQVTGIHVRIAQDVYTGAKSSSGTSGANGSSPQGMSAPALPPLPGVLQSQSASTAAAADTSGLSNIIMNSTTTPAAMLDQICNALGLSWEYKDGAAVVQRFVTRTFALKTPPGSSSFSFTSGKSSSGSSTSAAGAGGGGGGGGVISTGFTSDTSVKSSGAMNPMDSLLDTLKIVLTPAGKVVASPATGSIVVVDAVEGVDRAAKIIDRENEILSRNAKFHVEVVSLTETDQNDAGFDVNAAFHNLGKLGATLAAPTSVVSSTAGQLNLNLLGSGSRFDNSTAVIKALKQYGKVKVVHSVDVLARNRNLTPLAIQTQTVYLAQTTPAQSTGATSGAGSVGMPGLTPGVATTGFNITLQPNINDSNEIALQFQIGLIDLDDIKTLTSGTGASQQSIEAPQTSGFEFKQDVNLRPGETMVLSGYERSEAQYTSRKLANEIPLIAGGSFSGKTKRERIFILITPTVVGSSK